jgi:4-amino-4-deoxy-L-arabinose transferase
MIAAILLFALVYILPLGIRPMMMPDEIRYAEVPREMLASGDWVAPHLDGFRYFEKPVLGYWLVAVSTYILGDNNFATRLPAAISTGITALLLFFMVLRFVRCKSTALLAAVVFLTSFLVFGIGTFNVLDAPLSMFLTAAMVSFFYAFAENSTSRPRILYLVLFGIFCGLAFLTKGFLALAIPPLVVISFMFWQGRLRELLKYSSIPLAAAILVALPWSMMIHWRQPDFWNYFFWVEHIQRFTSASQGQHPEPFWYFLPVIIAGIMPWTPLTVCVAKGFRTADFREPLIRFCLCWLVLPFIFFSACSGKLATYVLPCFPPLTILIAVGLVRHSTANTGGISKAARIFAVILLILAAVVVLGQLSLLPFERIYASTETFNCFLLITALLIYAFILLMASRTSDYRSRLILWCLAPAFLLAAGPRMLPQKLIDDRTPGAFLTQNAYSISPSTTLVSDMSMVSAVCWYYQRNDVYLIGSARELAYGASYQDSKHRLLAPANFREFLAQHSPDSQVFFFTTLKRYADLSGIMPQPDSISYQSGFIMAEFRGTQNRKDLPGL